MSGLLIVPVAADVEPVASDFDCLEVSKGVAAVTVLDEFWQVKCSIDETSELVPVEETFGVGLGGTGTTQVPLEQGVAGCPSLVDVIDSVTEDWRLPVRPVLVVLAEL